MKNSGFSLLEVLLSLLILAGAVTGLLTGLHAAEALEQRAAFETSAAMYAEREIELLKGDLTMGFRKKGPAVAPGRFRLSGNWKTKLIWAPQPNEETVRMACWVESGDNRMVVESFLFLPEAPRSEK